jgi:hypothetical protein
MLLEASGRSEFLTLLVMAQTLSAVARAGERPEKRAELRRPMESLSDPTL